MANICDTTLSIQNPEGGKPFDDDRIKAITDDLTENWCDDIDEAYSDDDLFEINARTRWNVCADELRPIAKRHGVRIRAVGREDGVGFVEVACIEANGKIVQHEDIGYKF